MWQNHAERYLKMAPSQTKGKGEREIEIERETVRCSMLSSADRFKKKAWRFQHDIRACLRGLRV